MRRRVINYLRTVFFHYRIQSVRIANRAYQSMKLKLGVTCQKLVLYIIRIVFVYIENNQRSRSVLSYLTAQLASDRATAARNHDGLSANKLLYRLNVQTDRLTSQQILHLHLAYILYSYASVHHLSNAGQGLYLTSGGVTYVQNLCATSVGARRNCKYYQ